MSMRALTGSMLLLLLAAACSPAPIGEYPETEVDPSSGSKEGDGGKTEETPGPTGTFKLTVNITGSGTGSIMSTPSGLNCQDKTCTGTFKAGAAVGLVPAPAAGTTFGGWSGACTGTGACTPMMNSDITVGASLETLAGTFTGSYTHTAMVNNCTFNNKGTLTITIAADGAAFSNTGNITGLELRTQPGCNLVNAAATGVSPKEVITLSGAEATGTWTFAVQGASGNLALPYKATLNGKTLTGSWTCPTCTGSFTLTKP